MTISSRTPEGLPNHCPICNSDVCIEPSVLIGDATCPNCGSLLWFLNVESTTRVYDRSTSRGIRDRVITIVARQLGVAPEKIAENVSFVNDFGADSLDTVELVMELEEEFDRPQQPLGKAVKSIMPEISRFLGIVIRMYYRDHPPPHFHAEYGEHEITVEIESGVVEGRFPRRALSAVLDWYDLHRDELAHNQELARQEQPLNRIEPLE